MNFIQSKFPDGNLSRGKHGYEWMIACPMCSKRGFDISDGRKHNPRTLQINLQNNLCYCFRCGYKTHVKKFLWELDHTTFETSKPVVTLSGLRGKLANLQAPIESIRVEIPGFKLLEYPGKFEAYAERLEAYLWDRGWTSKEIHDRQVGFSLESSKFLNRLIFPFSSVEGELCYYQARTVKPDIQPKYRNPPISKDFALYNLKSASRYETCILVEGIFDCVLPNMVACLSHEPTEGQMKALAGLWRDFIVLFDQDAYISGWKAAKRLSALHCKSRVAWCPAKDPCEASLVDLEKEILDARTYDQFNYLKTQLSSSFLPPRSEA